MRLAPITLADAKLFVRREHRHNKTTVGWKFGVGVEIDGELGGAAVVGRPKAQELANAEPRTIEITRCTTTGEQNACSMLYGAACRMAKAGGYWSVITYTLASEPGTSLRAAGFYKDAVVPAEETHRAGRYAENLLGEKTRPAEEKIRWRRNLVRCMGVDGLGCHIPHDPCTPVCINTYGEAA